VSGILRVALVVVLSLAGGGLVGCGGGGGDDADAAMIAAPVASGDVELVADDSATAVAHGPLPEQAAAQLFEEPLAAGLDGAGQLQGDALEVAEVIEFRYQLELIRISSGGYPANADDVPGGSGDWLVSYRAEAEGYELKVKFSSGESAMLRAPE
jgi:hypothetical protein